MGNDKMGNDKSILQKIADTVKDIAAIATDAANDALKAEAPAPKAAEAVVTDVPLAAEGLVSNPMMMPPMALAPVRRKKRTAARAAKKPAKTRAKEKTIVKKAGKKSAARKSKKVAKKTDKKPFKKTKKIASKNTAKKKSTKKVRRAQ